MRRPAPAAAVRACVFATAAGLLGVGVWGPVRLITYGVVAYAESRCPGGGLDQRCVAAHLGDTIPSAVNGGAILAAAALLIVWLLVPRNDRERRGVAPTGRQEEERDPDNRAAFIGVLVVCGGTVAVLAVGIAVLNAGEPSYSMGPNKTAAVASLTSQGYRYTGGDMPQFKGTTAFDVVLNSPSGPQRCDVYLNKGADIRVSVTCPTKWPN